MPLPANRCRGDRREQRQKRIVIIQFAQVLHNLNELADVFLAIFGVFLAQDLRACPVEMRANRLKTNPSSRLHHNLPIRHLIKVLRELREMRRSFFTLLLRVDQHLGYVDFAKQLGVEQRHLGGNVRRLEIEQRRRIGDDRTAGQNFRVGRQVFVLLV